MQKKQGQIHPVDQFTGERLRYARCQRGMTQDYLAKAFPEPITFQQIQKYERGSNRMSVSRLHDLASLLDVPIAFFFPAELCHYPVLSPIEMKLLECHGRLSKPQQSALICLLKMADGGIVRE